MAQTRKKRRRKHRGTQAGTIERPVRASRPQTKEQRREAARERRLQRFDKPPTWRSSAQRAVLAAVLFAVLMTFLADQSWQQTLPLFGFVLLLYVPLSYYTDRLFYQRRQKQKATAAREAEEARRRPRTPPRPKDDPGAEGPADPPPAGRLKRLFSRK